jgi:hypothetical protein
MGSSIVSEMRENIEQDEIKFYLTLDEFDIFYADFVEIDSISDDEFSEIISLFEEKILTKG